jgi:membrane associated rhomboid family serine protease
MAGTQGRSIGASVGRQARQWGALTPVGLLVIINVIVFVAMHFAAIIHPSGGANLLDRLTLPLSRLEILRQPWSLLTYMFVQVDLFHLLFNTLGLAIFGFWLSQTAGRVIVIPLYVLGALAGGFITLLAAHIPGAEVLFRHDHLMGGTAGVMAIVLASTLFMPDHVVHLYFLFPIKMKYLGLSMVALDVLSLIFLHNPAGHISHLTGAMVGVIFIRSIPRRERRRLVSLTELLKQSGIKDFDRITSGRRPLRDDEHQHLRVSREEQLDRILDKINREGVHSLTTAEKKFLDEYSRSL